MNHARRYPVHCNCTTDTYLLPHNSHPFFAPKVREKYCCRAKIAIMMVDSYFCLKLKPFDAGVFSLILLLDAFIASIHLRIYFRSLKVFKIRHLWTIANLITLVHRKILFTPSVRQIITHFLSVVIYPSYVIALIQG